LKKNLWTADKRMISNMRVAAGVNMLQNNWPSLSTGRILWHDLNTGKWIWDLECGMWSIRCLYRAGSLKTVARKLGKYTLDWVGVQGVRWDKGGTERAEDYIYILLWSSEWRSLVRDRFLAYFQKMKVGFSNHQPLCGPSLITVERI
jgi:hypothetical protein